MSKYIRVYETLCPDDQISDDDPRRSGIIAEMRAIHLAKTADDAIAVVAWWDWVHEERSALQFVRKARKLMKNAHD